MVKPPPVIPVQLLGDSDVSLEIGDDPAYLAVIDVASYDTTLEDWDYETLSAHLVDAMSAGHAVVWGIPEGPHRVRLTTHPFRDESNAHFSTVLEVTGPVCICGYTTLTMVAQFKERALPQGDDAMVTLTPGRYEVAVHRRFAHEDGSPDWTDTPDKGDAYIVVFTRAADAELVERDLIEWGPLL